MFENFKKFKVLVEKQSGYFIKEFRTNRGREFFSMEFKNFCDNHGIHHELISPYTPEQNGIVERNN